MLRLCRQCGSTMCTSNEAGEVVFPHIKSIVFAVVPQTILDTKSRRCTFGLSVLAYLTNNQEPGTRSLAYFYARTTLATGALRRKRGTA